MNNNSSFKDCTSLVSVVIPCYNSASFIEESVNSVLSQTYDNIEIVVVDDASTDETVLIVNRLISIHKSISLHLIDVNSGSGYARNIGIEKSKGRYIAFLDADDVWLPDKIKIQLDLMNKYSAPICHTSYSCINHYGHPVSGGVIASKFLNFKKYMMTTEIGLSTSIIDRKLIKDLKFDLVRTRQDTLLWIKLLHDGGFSVGVQDFLVMYRLNSNQISSNKFKMLIRTFKVYWALVQLSPFVRIYYYICYIISAIAKRLRRR